jgi:hypothetical protein
MLDTSKILDKKDPDPATVISSNTNMIKKANYIQSQKIYICKTANSLYILNAVPDFILCIGLLR